MEEKENQFVEENTPDTETVELETVAAAEASVPESAEAVAVAEEETVAAAEETESAEAAEETEEAVAEAPVPPAPEKPEKKPVDQKKLLIIVGAAVALIAIVFAIVFFTVLKPNGILADAKEALAQGSFLQCEELLNKIPNHKGTPAVRRELDLAMAENYIQEGDLEIAEGILAKYIGDADAKALRDEIQYVRASDLVNQQKFDEAKAIMDKIPDHADPNQLREAISYELALAAVETGDYKTAYETFLALGDYKDAATQKDTIYYEALAFKSLFNIQQTLKNPASMRVTKVTFYKDSSTEGELDAIYEFTASNSFGGNIGAYGYDLSLYNENENSGMMSSSAYWDPDDYLELLQQMTIDAIKRQTVLETNVDVARMNRLLTGNVTFNIDLPFQSGAVVES